MKLTCKSRKLPVKRSFFRLTTGKITFQSGLLIAPNYKCHNRSVKNLSDEGQMQ